MHMLDTTAGNPGIAAAPGGMPGMSPMPDLAREVNPSLLNSKTLSAAAEFLADNPFDSLTLGCDFVRNHAPRSIDFATIHLWPDSWLPAGGSSGGSSEEAALRFARRWINAHVDACAQHLGKPLVLAEFGSKPAGPARAAFYGKVRLSLMQTRMLAHPMTGGCLCTSRFQGLQKNSLW
jgi:hypothetical protein